jgi:hypothetical protein
MMEISRTVMGLWRILSHDTLYLCLYFSLLVTMIFFLFAPIS